MFLFIQRPKPITKGDTNKTFHTCKRYRETQRERERDRDRETDRQKQKQKQRERE